MDIHKGTIRGFHGSHGSGIAELEIQDAITGAITLIPCENGTTVRSLEAAFGNVISPGHSVDPDGGHIDQEIYWQFGEFGMVMGGFVPVGEASVEMVEEYEQQE